MGKSQNGPLYTEGFKCMVLRGQRGVEIQKKEKKTQKIHLFQVVAPIKLCIVKTAVLAGGALALLSTFYDNIDGIQKAI